MDADEFTYDRGFRSSDSEGAFIEGSIDEILAAMENVIVRDKKFGEIIARGDGVIIVKTAIFNKMMRRVVRVSYFPMNGKRREYSVRATTMNDMNDFQPTGLARKLLIETLKELGREEEAKKFSKESNRRELKSFGKGIAGGMLSLVKAVAIIILIMIALGVIAMIL